MPRKGIFQSSLSIGQLLESLLFVIWSFVLLLLNNKKDLVIHLEMLLTLKYFHVPDFLKQTIGILNICFSYFSYFSYLLFTSLS